MPSTKQFPATISFKNLTLTILATTLCTSVLNKAVAGTIELDPVRDIWTTSVFSYIEGPSSGPGGGLDNEDLRVGGWGDEYRTLLQFDYSGVTQPVSKATLELFHIGPPDPYSPVSMHLDRVTSEWDWTDNPLDAGTLDQERLWWDDKPDFVATPTVLAAPSVMSSYSIDITDIVKGQLDGTYDNYGVQLRPTSTWQDFNYFASSENANEDWRPKLIIDTSAPQSDCGSINFADSVSTEAFGPTMTASFRPANGCSLDEVAEALGYDHFNWVQIVTEYDGLLLQPVFNGFYYSAVSLFPPFLDPPDGGYLGHPADSLPYYWDEGEQWEEGYRLRDNIVGEYLNFEDTPHLNWINQFIPGRTMSFTTSLVGVIEDDIWVPEFTFNWSSNYQADSGEVYEVNVARALEALPGGVGEVLSIDVLEDPLAVSAELRELWRSNGAAISVPVIGSVPLLIAGMLMMVFSNRSTFKRA